MFLVWTSPLTSRTRGRTAFVGSVAANVSGGASRKIWKATSVNYVWLFFMIDKSGVGTC